MKTLRLTILAAIVFLPLLFCKKPMNDQVSINKELNVASVAYPPLGDQNRTPDLYIPVDETDWAGDTSYHVGIAANDPTIRFANGKTYVRYICPIANAAYPRWTGIDWTGNDLVICKPCDGVPIGGGNYDFPGMIAIKLFKSGELVSDLYKVEYNISNGINKTDCEWWKLRDYGWPDTMYVSFRCADIYHNDVELPNGVQDGSYALSIHINYQGRIVEQNYNNNISVLPFRIIGGVPVVDYSTVPENKIQPVKNVTETHKLTGNPSQRYATVNWESTNDWFCVHKIITYSNGSKSDDIVLPDVYDAITFTDNSPDIQQGNVKEIVYTIKSMADGLPISDPVSITVKK